MANVKLHELTNEQLNPVDGDLMEVSHETSTGSGVWGSFFMKLLTIKTWVLSALDDITLLNKLTDTSGVLTYNGTVINGFKKTTYVFTVADIWEYEPVQFEFVQAIFFKPTLATTIEVGTLTEAGYYVAETSETSHPINRFCDEANQSDRSMNVIVNGSGSVTIISILI